MTKEEYISLAVGRITDKKERRLAYDELSDHIDERVNFYSDCGYDAETAFEKAVSQMGSPETAAQQLGMVHSTLLETIGSVFTSLVGLAAFLFIGLMSFLIAFLKDSDFRFYFLEFYIFEIIAMAITIGFALYSNYKKNKILSVMSAIFISLMLFFGVFYLFLAGSDLLSGIIMLLKNGDAQESFKSAYQEFLNIRSPLIIILYATVTGNAECIPAMIKLSSVYFQSFAVSIASVMFYAVLAVCIYRSNKTIHRFCSDNASKSDCEKRRRLMRQLVCFAFCIITVSVIGAVVCLTSDFKSDDSNYCSGFYIVESDSETDFESIDYENARKIDLSQNIPLTDAFDRYYYDASEDGGTNGLALDVLTQTKEMDLPGAEYSYNLVKAEHRPSKRYVAVIPEYDREEDVPYTEENTKLDFSSAHWVDTYSTDVFTQNYKPNKYPELVFEITIVK